MRFYLLAQARIGHDSYTVIGQGLVDQALSLRAEERRGLFEDAAGIRQFQAQRTEAEQKLTLTQSNLSRLRDILGEIEPRLAPLAEQARRAREFAGAHEDLARLLRQWYRRQWTDLHTTSAAADAAEHEIGDANSFSFRRCWLNRTGSVSPRSRGTREPCSGQIAQVRRERGAGLDALQTAERELAVARERIDSVEQQQSDLCASSRNNRKMRSSLAGRMPTCRWRRRLPRLAETAEATAHPPGRIRARRTRRAPGTGARGSAIAGGATRCHPGAGQAWRGTDGTGTASAAGGRAQSHTGRPARLGGAVGAQTGGGGGDVLEARRSEFDVAHLEAVEDGKPSANRFLGSWPRRRRPWSACARRWAKRA